MACVLALALSACGPSAAEIRKARTAIYDCDEATVVQRITSEMKSRTGRAQADPGRHLVLSSHRWHSSTGVPHQKHLASPGPGDLAFGFVVSYERVKPGWLLRAKPSVIAHVVGSPRGEELREGDADWPDWASGKVDTLMVSIHDKLSHECPNVTYAQ